MNNGILDRINQVKGVVDTAEKYGNVANSLFGKKPSPMAAEPSQERAYEPDDEYDFSDPGSDYEEPGDYSFSEVDDYRPPRPQYDRPHYDRPRAAPSPGREFLQNQGIQMDEFRNDRNLSVSDTHLRSLAKMKVAQLNLKSSLKTEPFRIGLSFLFKKLGRADISEDIKGVDIEDGFENFNELLEDIVFEELKDLQRNDNLRVPPAEELMQHRQLMLFEKMAGPGFGNVMVLMEEGFKKISKGRGNS